MKLLFVVMIVKYNLVLCSLSVNYTHQHSHSLSIEQLIIKVKITVNLPRLTSAVMWKESWTVLLAALQCLGYGFWGRCQWQLIKLQLSSLRNYLFELSDIMCDWWQSQTRSKIYLSLPVDYCTLFFFFQNKVPLGPPEGAWHQLSTARAVLLSHHRACEQHLCFPCSGWSICLLWRKV